MKDKYKDIGGIGIRTIEECSELIKAISKAERFGFGSRHPDRINTYNALEIIEEINDVIAQCEEMKAFCLKVKAK